MKTYPDLKPFAAALLLSLAWAKAGFAATPRDYAVEVQAAVQEVPARVTLSWTQPTGGSTWTGYTVSRKTWGETSWTAMASGLDPSTVSWTDATVSAGTLYEYQIQRTGIGGGPSVSTVYGYTSAAVNRPLTDSRGSVVLLVDNTLAATLSSELAALRADLEADGWRVLRHDVERSTAVVSSPSTTETSVYDPADNKRYYCVSGYHSDADGAKVRAVKQLILNDFAADPKISHVLIVGHVVVPYSGLLNPDGHGEHLGAWPADTYYGDIAGTWTDTTVNQTDDNIRRNFNAIGDGRFDQSTIPGTGVQLAVGRVDLANFPSFSPLGETDLLRRYLAKDHAWRTGQWQVQSKCLIEDDFGDLGSSWVPAVTGWRASSLVGVGNVVQGVGNQAPTDWWFSRLALPGYLTACGSAWGAPYQATGVGCSGNFADNASYAVFTTLFGSYLGDWNYYDSLLRAPLAGSGYGLTCAWAGGRPYMVWHRMALGATIGDTVQLVQASTASLYPDQGANSRGVHFSLMGDPTLRAHPIAPPRDVVAAPAGSSVALGWTASSTANLAGYHVYRALSASGPFTRVSGVPATAANPSGSPVAETAWTDTCVPAGTWYYQVKAVRRESTPGGTYFNASQGAAAQAAVPGVPASELAITAQPQNTTAYVGQTAAFAVSAAGSSPVTYQWQKNGVDIAGARAAGYTTPALAADDLGSVYRVLVRNASGGIASNDAVLTVLGAPIFQASFSGTGRGTGGANDLVDRGGTGTLGSSAGCVYTIDAASTMGEGNCLNLSVSNTSTGAKTVATWTPASDANSWKALTGTATSGGVVYTAFNGGFDFFIRPHAWASGDQSWCRMVDIESRQGTAGTRFIFSGGSSGFQFQVVGGVGTTPFGTATGTFSLNYVALGSTLALAADTVHHVGVTFNTDATGRVTVKIFGVTGGAAIDTTSNAQLLASTNFYADASVIGSAPINGGAWTTTARSNSTPWVQTSVDFDLMRLYSADPRIFPAIAPAAAAPAVSVQPQSRSVTAGQTATFSVTATGVPVPGYQWQRNGVTISGATSASYTIPATSPADDGAAFCVLVSNSAGSVLSGTAVLSVANSYSAWGASHFGAGDLSNDSISGPDANPAGDGLSNLLKYGLGLDPAANGSADAPKAETKTVSGDGYLHLTFRRQKNAPDLAYAVQASDDLQTWNSGPAVTASVSQTDNGDGTMTVVERDLSPVSGNGRRFLRLQIIRQ